MQLKPYKVHHDVLMASASEEQVTEDGAGQAAFNLINHVQQSKGGRGVDKGDKLNISSSLSIMDQRGGWRDEDREPRVCLPYRSCQAGWWQPERWRLWAARCRPSLSGAEPGPGPPHHWNQRSWRHGEAQKIDERKKMEKREESDVWLDD